MKKFKKIFSVALASLLALTVLPTMAFADDTTAKTDVTVYKTVSVDRSAWGTLLPTEIFTIQMKPATTEQLNPTVDGVVVPATDLNGNVVASGPELTTDKVTLTFDASDSTASGSVEKSAKFTFDFAGEFNNTGVYRYYITEEADENKAGYITYDSTTYSIDLYVEQDDDANYYVKDYVVTDLSKNEKPQKINFENVVNCKDLIIAKNVEGVEYQKGEYYTFRLLIPAGGKTIYLENGEKFQAQILDSNNIPVIDDRTDENGYLEITVNGDDLDADMEEFANEFQLRSGEKLKVIGAPVTMVYKVEEVTDTEEFQKEGYTVSYDYIEYGKNDTGTANDPIYDEEGNSVIGTINTSQNEVHFINSRIISTPTGVILEVLPYALVVLAAGCGIALILIYKKRRAVR